MRRSPLKLPRTRKEPALNAVTTPYNSAHHRFAVFTAVATFLLIVAGALVTSNQAGLSVPDWPTSFGSMYRLPAMVGGVKYEHSHRMIAEFLGLLTITIAVWTMRTDRRSWIRKLAWGALGTIIVQGILGGITVLKFLPPLVSTAHAIVGQTFFCIAVAIAVFTGKKWVAQSPEPAQEYPTSLKTMCLLSLAVVYLQLFLGGMFRHNGMDWLPHVINAMVVVLILTWTAESALIRYSRIEAIRKPALAVIALEIVQVGLGFLALITKVILGKDAPQPTLDIVASTVAHTAVGALLLASVAVLTIQAFRHLDAPAAEQTSKSPAVAA